MHNISEIEKPNENYVTLFTDYRVTFPTFQKGKKEINNK